MLYIYCCAAGIVLYFFVIVRAVRVNVNGGVAVASKDFMRSTRRETIVIVALYLIFFAWWYVTAYGFGDVPAEYGYILGFPVWFFYSCIVGYVGISLILWGAVRVFFKDLPLDDEEKTEDESNG